MVKGGLGPSSIRNYTNVVKRVVSSAVDDKGKKLLAPRDWNHEFIDMPADSNPKRPCFTGDVVTKIITNASKRPMYGMLYTLCAASGLRFGEALGIMIENISPDATTIKIHCKAYRGKVHTFLKSKAGKREVDLYPKIAATLKEFVGDRKSGLLFASRTGRPLQQTNILRRNLHPILKELGEPKCGVHAFRRFRMTHIREYGVPRDLEHFGWDMRAKQMRPTEAKDRSATSTPCSKNVLRSAKSGQSNWASGSKFRVKSPQLDGMDGKSSLKPFWNWLHCMMYNGLHRLGV